MARRRRRNWDPEKHPRHLAEAPEGRGGQFRRKLDAGGWVGAISDRLPHAKYGPGQWRELSDDSILRDVMERSLTKVARKVFAQPDDNPDRPLTSWQSDALRDWVNSELVGIKPAKRIFQNGPHLVWVATDRPVDVDEALRLIDDLQTANPSREPFRIALGVAQGDMTLGSRTLGETIRGSGLMRVSESTFSPDEAAEIMKNWTLMPVFKEVDWPTYIIAHEWGHVVDSSSGGIVRGDSGDPWRDRAYEDMGPRDMPSNYGRLTPIEGYAELFAEWFLSGGKTTNRLARMYADRYGWRARGDV